MKSILTNKLADDNKNTTPETETDVVDKGDLNTPMAQKDLYDNLSKLSDEDFSKMLSAFFK